jgi:hypothetical protein
MQNHTCSDCGPAPINHRLAYFSVFSDWIFLPVIQILISVRRHVVAPLLLPLRFDRWALPVFRLLAKLHLGTVNEKLDEKNSLRTRALWESAEKLGIKIYEFRLFGRALETFVAVYKDQSKLFYEIPRPNVPLSSGFWWIDDKPLMRKYFTKEGIPVALGASCFTYAQALETFRLISGTSIAKPSYGSRSRHTTIHVRNEEQLHKAFLCAKKLSPFVLIEQELEGLVYRASVIAGKLAAVISRNPPTVRGDGIQTVHQLVAIENANPKRQNNKIFHKIPVNEDTNQALEKQGLDWDSIPENGKVVHLSDKVSRGVGAVTVDVTDKTHPDNVALFEKIARVVDDSVIGVDFIINDISASWKNQNLCGSFGESPSGKAPPFGGGIRRFESFLPSQRQIYKQT